jgi:hypothetical protein
MAIDEVELYRALDSARARARSRLCSPAATSRTALVLYDLSSS